MNFNDLSLENRVLKGLGVAFAMCNDIFEQESSSKIPSQKWYRARDYILAAGKAVDNARNGTENPQSDSLLEELRFESARILRGRNFRLVEEARNQRIESLAGAGYLFGVFSAYLSLGDYAFGDKRVALFKAASGALLILGGYCLSKLNYLVAKKTQSRLLEYINSAAEIMESDPGTFRRTIYNGYHQLEGLLPAVR